jgi:hypothetical protein
MRVVQHLDSQLVVSPSDLNNFLECEHLTQLELEVARGEIERPAPDNPQAELIRRKATSTSAPTSLSGSGGEPSRRLTSPLHASRLCCRQPAVTCHGIFSPSKVLVSRPMETELQDRALEVAGAPAAASTIGRIERLPLREVWRHEAHNLTTWLEGNIDVLNDVVDLNLTSIERERTAGSFSVDLVGEDASGGTVIIENQLARSDHDHLGKLIAYTALLEARAAIWIVAEPRPEHVRALAWLNESTPSDFYLLKIEGIRIGDSLPAPLLTRIVGPSEESREAGDIKKERAERHFIRRRFWDGLLERAKPRTRLHSAISPSEQGWISTGAGKSGLSFVYTITQHGSTVELYIDTGDADENTRLFDGFVKNKHEVEASYGSPLSWEPLETKRGCRIADRMSSGGWRDDEDMDWPRIQDEMVDSMIRLEQALRPYLDRL